MGRKRIKPIPDVIEGYTEKQTKFIRGEIEADDLDGRFFHHLLKASIKNDDKKIAEIAREGLRNSEYKKQLNNLKKSRERKKKVRSGEEIIWKQPKSNEYTDHQKKIVRGEIPLERVHTNELISIHQKAKNVGDIELSERIFDLIMDRREASRVKDLEGLKELRKKEFVEDFDDEFETRDHLIARERELLESRIDDDEFSLAHLKHIRDICRKTNDEKYLVVAENLVEHRVNPDSILITTDHDQAIQLLELMFDKPIRRPETWFTE